MDGLQRIRRRNRIIDVMGFGVVLFVVSAVTLVLFENQVYGNIEEYSSDMKAYILEMQGLDSGYHFPYPVFFKIAALIHLFMGPEWAVAVATMLLNSLSLVVTKLAFNRLALSELEDGFRVRLSRKWDVTWLAGIVISLLSASLFFISMLFPPEGIYLPGIRFRYMGVFTPNPFHNATYMAARPFAILAFLWYVKLLPVYENGAAVRKEHGKAALADYILFSLFLLIATMTKPSFTLVMVSAAGLLMVYRLFRSKFKNFVPTLQLGLCFIPTFLDLLYQYKGVFVPGEGEEGGVGFCFGEIWGQYCDNIPLAVCLAIGFPLMVLVLNWREWKRNTLFCFSWLLYLMSFLEAFFLYEKGYRDVHFNFSWGYMCGIFFCHFAALLTLLQITAREMIQRASADPDAGKKGEAFEKGRIRYKIIGKTFLLAAQWLAFFWHVACGIYYFYGIFLGETYY